MRLLLGLLLLLAACAPAAPASDTPRLSVTGVFATPRPGPDLTRAYTASDPAQVGAMGRPQFINVYAAWCTTCTSNRPIVRTLEYDYSGKVDFLHLDMDQRASEAARLRVGLLSRATYALLDAEGTVVMRWYGPLRQSEVAAVIDSVLAG